MINLIILQTIVLVTIIFLSYSHPIILSGLLICARFVFGVTTYLSINTPWLAYILIIVFVSGMIIILIYISRLTSNLNTSNKIELPNFILASVVGLAIWFNYEKRPFLKIDTSSLAHKQTNHSLELIYKIYNIGTWEITLILITYLLFLIIAAIKIISKNSSPLRTKTN